MTVMFLSQWINEHKGTVARIGTNAGSGFVFAGKVDSFTLNHIEAKTGIKMHARQVVDEYPSAYSGVIVIVTGQEYGKEDLSDLHKKGALVPIELYHALIGEVVKIAAEDYENACLRFHYAKRERDIERASADMYLSQRFFRSDSFAILMPHVDGEDVLRLIEQKVDRMIHDE